MDAEIKTSGIIMTYPKRLSQAKILSAMTGYELCVDLYGKGAFENSKDAWSKLSEKDCTHGILIQDDTLPCPHFETAIENIIKLYPDKAISLYNIYTQAPKLYSKKINFIETSFYQFGPAWVMPKETILKIILWFSKNLTHVPFSDPAYSLYFHLHKQTVLVVIPSIFQHTGTAETSYRKNLASDSRATIMCSDGSKEIFTENKIYLEKTDTEIKWLRKFLIYLK